MDNRKEAPESCGDNEAFCCPNCGVVLGSTDGWEVVIGAVRIREPIKLTCVACGEPYEWAPEEPNS